MHRPRRYEHINKYALSLWRWNQTDAFSPFIGTDVQAGIGGCVLLTSSDTADLEPDERLWAAVYPNTLNGDDCCESREIIEHDGDRYCRNCDARIGMPDEMIPEWLREERMIMLAVGSGRFRFLRWSFLHPEARAALAETLTAREAWSSCTCRGCGGEVEALSMADQKAQGATHVQAGSYLLGPIEHDGRRVLDVKCATCRSLIADGWDPPRDGDDELAGDRVPSPAEVAEAAASVQAMEAARLQEAQETIARMRAA